MGTTFDIVQVFKAAVADPRGLDTIAELLTPAQKGEAQERLGELKAYVHQRLGTNVGAAEQRLSQLALAIDAELTKRKTARSEKQPALQDEPDKLNPVQRAVCARILKAGAAGIDNNALLDWAIESSVVNPLHAAWQPVASSLNNTTRHLIEFEMVVYVYGTWYGVAFTPQEEQIVEDIAVHEDEVSAAPIQEKRRRGRPRKPRDTEAVVATSPAESVEAAPEENVPTVDPTLEALRGYIATYCYSGQSFTTNDIIAWGETNTVFNPRNITRHPLRQRALHYLRQLVDAREIRSVGHGRSAHWLPLNADGTSAVVTPPTPVGTASSVKTVTVEKVPDYIPRRSRVPQRAEAEVENGVVILSGVEYLVYMEIMDCDAPSIDDLVEWATKQSALNPREQPSDWISRRVVEPAIKNLLAKTLIEESDGTYEAANPETPVRARGHVEFISGHASANYLHLPYPSVASGVPLRAVTTAEEWIDLVLKTLRRFWLQDKPESPRFYRLVELIGVNAPGDGYSVPSGKSLIETMINRVLTTLVVQGKVEVEQGNRQDPVITLLEKPKKPSALKKGAQVQPGGSEVMGRKKKEPLQRQELTVPQEIVTEADWIQAVWDFLTRSKGKKAKIRDLIDAFVHDNDLGLWQIPKSVEDTERGRSVTAAVRLLDEEGVASFDGVAVALIER